MLILREQYAAWKAECTKMVPMFDSGKFITTPIVTDDGEPVEGEAGNLNGPKPVIAGVTDKEVIQWKLSLSQIGLYSVNLSLSVPLTGFCMTCFCS